MSVVADIAYAAGFLEGEGHFGVNAGTRGCGIGMAIRAFQVHREPLDRLVKVFGGSVVEVPAKRKNSQDGHRWTLSGTRAAAAVMTMFPMLSPRRQARCKALLEEWKALGIRRDTLRQVGFCSTHGVNTVAHRRPSGRIDCLRCRADHREAVRRAD